MIKKKNNYEVIYLVRPTKCRKVGYMPENLAFKPAGIAMEDLETVILNIDELETVRLADYEELYFEEAAERMGVSRQTFGNILKSAHKKIADALINGKTLKIEGGDVEILKDKDFYCKKCRKRDENSEKCKNCFEEK